MTPVEIKPATFQLLPLFFNQLRHRVSQLNTVHTEEFWTENSIYSSIPDVLFEWNYHSTWPCEWKFYKKTTHL